MQSEIDFFSNLHTSLLRKINFDYEEKSTIIIDLVTTMGVIYCKDVSTKKTNDKPRFIELTIPVFNREIWSENIKLIENLVKWVSEDTFSITFTDTSTRSDGYVNSLIPGISNDVTLFSGGLDSFAGAYHNYKYNIKSDYIGFINKDEEKTKQIDVSKFYRQVFDDSISFL